MQSKFKSNNLDRVKHTDYARTMESCAFKRVSNACRLCRVRKVKCDGSVPCGNCKDRGKTCKYLPRVRRYHKANSATHNDKTALIERTLHLDNDVITTGNETVAPRIPSPTPAESGFAPRSIPRQVDSQVPLVHQSPASFSNVFSPDNMTFLQGIPSPVNPRPPEVTSPGPIAAVPAGNNERRNGLPTPDSSALDREQIVISPESAVWEYHGPMSWASICSGPGKRWVQERTGTKTFDNSAQQLILGLARTLKVPHGATRERCGEPDMQRAWRYTKAYFENSYDRNFGIVYRPDFEAQLRRHFETNGQMDHDSAWYALRNAIYAEGCRSAMSKDQTRNFSSVQSESARYFENAISVLTDLLFTPNGLMAVQALAVMISYAEGLGSPALEYILCSNAVRMAQSKGLHCQPSKAWGLSESDVTHRNWLFWVIYCYEKYIVLRSGRPSILDDDDISCEIPETAVPGSTIDPTFLRAVIEHAQICSLMAKRLSSIRTLRNSPENLMDVVRQLGNSLDSWWSSLPESLRNNNYSDNNIRFCHMYHGSRIALHANFTYPWISVLIAGNKSQDFQDQLLLSAKKAAESAREIIISTRKIDANVSSPAWLIFYYPMLAVINLFIHILKYPHTPAVQSDLALLDIAAGHFGHVKLLTGSEVEYSFPREIAILANKFLQDKASKSTEAYESHDTTADAFSMPSGSEIQGNINDLSTYMTALSAPTDSDFETWNAMSAEVLDGFLGTNGTVFF